jgi:hypothetical protein
MACRILDARTPGDDRHVMPGHDRSLARPARPLIAFRVMCKSTRSVGPRSSPFCVRRRRKFPGMAADIRSWPPIFLDTCTHLVVDSLGRGAVWRNENPGVPARGFQGPLPQLGQATPTEEDPVQSMPDTPVQYKSVPPRRVNRMPWGLWTRVCRFVAAAVGALTALVVFWKKLRE